MAKETLTPEQEEAQRLERHERARELVNAINQAADAFYRRHKLWPNTVTLTTDQAALIGCRRGDTYKAGQCALTVHGDPRRSAAVEVALILR